MPENFDYRLYFPAENYVLIDFGNRIDAGLNKYILALTDALKHDAIIEVIPAYSSILLEYDPRVIKKNKLSAFIKKTKPDKNHVTGKCHNIPVVYGKEQGPDLSFVAKNSGLTEQEVIKLHTSVDYRVYMIGFLPGFCYLGGLDERLETRRLETPRLLIPAGSVGIAGKQTGIYPVESPGGWRIIGKTNFRLYQPDGNPVFPVKPGDSIRFQAVLDV